MLFVSSDQMRPSSSSLEGNIAFLKTARIFPKAFHIDTYTDNFLYKIESLRAQSTYFIFTKKIQFSSDLQNGDYAGELLDLTHAPGQMQNMRIRKLVLLKRKQICRENAHGIFCVASSENPNCSRLP